MMELVKALFNRQYIDGEWVESANKNTRDIINPYNQEVIFTVTEGTKEDAEQAILADVVHLKMVSGHKKQVKSEVKSKSNC